MSTVSKQLTTGGTGGSGTSFNTASITAQAKKLLLIAVGEDNGGGAAPTTSISGLNLTWTLVDTKLNPGGTRRISLFRTVTNVSVSGVITITHNSSVSNGTAWSVTQFSKVDNSGNQGANGIVQSVTNNGSGVSSLQVTLGAFSSINNATYGCIFINATFSITAGSGFTQLGQDNSGGSIQAEFKSSNDTSVDWSWSGGAEAAAIAVELKYRPDVSFSGGMI